MFSITWNNSFTDSLNDLLTALSAVGNLNGQLCHAAGVRKTDHVLKSVYKHAQKDKEEDMMKFASIYIWDIRVKSWGNSGEILKKNIFKLKNQF